MTHDRAIAEADALLIRASEDYLRAEQTRLLCLHIDPDVIDWLVARARHLHDAARRETLREIRRLLAQDFPNGVDRPTCTIR
jgi:hypothetical protein